MNLSGSTVLVTGGAVRIGRAICTLLSARGATVVIHYNRSGSKAAELAALLAQSGGSAFTVQGDLSDGDTCARIVEEAVSVAGRLDGLVNNAAIFHKCSFLDTEPAEIDCELAVNYEAPVRLMRAFAGYRASNCEGSERAGIVNMLDRRIAGHDTDCVPYVISKKMLAAYTREAALALAPGISVNGVAPGAVLPPPGEGAAYVRDYAGPVPLECDCTPRDVAEAVCGLLESDVMTGQIVFVDGGQHLVG